MLKESARDPRTGSIRSLTPWVDPGLLGLGVAGLVTAANLLTGAGVGIGLLVLSPLLAAALGASRGRTAALAALALSLGVGIALLEGFFDDARPLAPVLTLVLGGLFAVYLAGLRAQRDDDDVRLQIQYSVARTLQESRTLEEAAPRLLEAIGLPLGWEVGGLWEVRLTRTLRSVASWYASGVEGADFEKMSRRFVLRPGVGLPGRVWESGEPAWIFDVAIDPNFPRAEVARKAGLHGAVGFPLRTSTGVVGVMEFFAREVREPDAELLALLGALGGQIGEFVEVRSREEAERASEARKAAMLESALDCVVTLDHEGLVVEFNPAAQRTFGYSAEEAVGNEMAELIIPPALRSAQREALAAYVETGRPTILGRRIELTGMRKDGVEFPIELAINSIGGHSPPMFTGYIRDITDRQGAERERERLLKLEQLARVDADRAREQLSAILRGVADAVTAQAPDGTLVFANDRAVETLGFSSMEELLATPPSEVRGRFEAFEEDGTPIPVERLPGQLALQGQAAPEPALVRYRSAHARAERWAVVKATPIFDEDGEVAMAINVIEDVTSLKRTEQAQRLLAEAGRVLASSLDTDELLARVASLTVPDFADWCGVHLTREDGVSRLAAVAAGDGDAAGAISELARRYPPDRDGAVGLPQVLRTGEPGLYPDVTEELFEEGARDPGQRDLMRRVGRHSALIAPIVSRGRLLGAVSLYRTGEPQPYDGEDLAVAEELGRRVGSAVENATLYTERSYIAKTLQQSLLPAQLPTIPGLEAAARFRATGEGNEVGGDFYDLFEAAGGRWSIVVGDVCGKGPEAAAVTALARYTLRAAAMLDPKPSSGLRMLNEALLQQRSDLRFATVAYASLAPHNGGVAVAVASAGHPLPLLLRVDGSVEAVGVHGTLAGVVPDPDLEDSAASLNPGDALILYTDGVTEARNENGMLGEARLAEIVAGCAGIGADDIAARIEGAAVDIQDGRTRDDIAVVVLRAAQGS